MVKRIITGLLLAAFSIALIIWGELPLALYILVLSGMGMNEYIFLANRHKIRPSKTMAFFALLILMPFAYFGSEEYLPPLLFAITLITILFYIFRKGFHVSSFLDVGATILGIFYLGWFFCYMIYMRKMVIPGTMGAFKFLGTTIDQGAGFVLVLVFATSLTDTGAYFMGKFFGKHKLCPSISPGKTVEGAIGGMLGAIAGAFLIGLPLKLMPTDILNIGALCGIFAQLGDLWESVLKRDAHAKDSGSAIAGHGGIMDRIDSLLFTAPVVYFYIKYFML